MRATLIALTAAAACAALPASALAQGEEDENPFASLTTGLDYAAIGATPGVRVVRSGGRAAMVFDARAARRYRRLAGKVVLVSCGRVRLPEEQNVAPTWRDTKLRAPRSRAAFRARLDPSADACTVGVRERVRFEGESFETADTTASVALNERGAISLDRTPTAKRLTLTWARAILRDIERPFPGTAELVRRAGGVTVALSAPDGEPPAAPAVGAWSNGTDHMVLRARTPLGYPMYIEHRGEVETKNTAFWG